VHASEFVRRTLWRRVSRPFSSLCRRDRGLTVKLLTVLEALVFFVGPPAVGLVGAAVPALIPGLGGGGSERGPARLRLHLGQLSEVALCVEGDAQGDHDGGVVSLCF